MLNTLFEKQRRSLDRFFDEIDLEQAEKVLDRLAACRGVIIFSGVGKSGHIAEKIATTFLSTGTRSFFLNPANALHGDLGFVSAEDLVVCLSKSGESQELIHLLPHIHRKGASTIGVVSVPNSRLSKMCSLSMVLPVSSEICPYGLAPTTSSAVQLIFGDCLAMALMERKHFSLADFAANHPSGLLGRKITAKVADIMLQGSELPLCKPTDVLIDVLHELSAKRCGCLLVTDEAQSLRGIFTDGDLRRAIQTQGPDALHMKLESLMTLSPKTISPDSLALQAAQCMEEDPARLITVLPVLVGKQVVGLIRMHDILQQELS